MHEGGTSSVGREQAFAASLPPLQILLAFWARTVEDACPYTIFVAFGRGLRLDAPRCSQAFAASLLYSL